MYFMFAIELYRQFKTNSKVKNDFEDMRNFSFKNFAGYNILKLFIYIAGFFCNLINKKIFIKKQIITYNIEA